MDVNLRILQIVKFDEDILLLVIHDCKYRNRVPIQIGPGVINNAMGLITKLELDIRTDTWKQTHTSVVLAKANQVNKHGFQLEKMKGKVTAEKPVVIYCSETVEIKGKTRSRGHSQKVHVVTRPSVRPFSDDVFIQGKYSKLKSGSSKVTVCLCNITAKEIKITSRRKLDRSRS